MIKSSFNNHFLRLLLRLERGGGHDIKGKNGISFNLYFEYCILTELHIFKVLGA